MSASAASADTTIGTSTDALAIDSDWANTGGSLFPNLTWAAQGDVSTESGTITTWRMRANFIDGTAQLLVLHPSGPGWDITAASTAQPVSQTGVNVFPTNLPVAVGDAIAVTGNGTYVALQSGSGTLIRWDPPTLTPGTDAGAPNVIGPYRIALNADVTASRALPPVVSPPPAPAAPAAPAPSPAPARPQPICGRMPTLVRHSVIGARYILNRDSCRVAVIVVGNTRPGGRLRNRISRQSVAPGTTLFAGATVTVRINGSPSRAAA